MTVAKHANYAVTAPTSVTSAMTCVMPVANIVRIIEMPGVIMGGVTGAVAGLRTAAITSLAITSVTGIVMAMRDLMARNAGSAMGATRCSSISAMAMSSVFTATVSGSGVGGPVVLPATGPLAVA